MRKKIRFNLFFGFLIFIFCLMFNYKLVYAATCYQCNSNANLFRCNIGTSATSDCPSGWHTSNSSSCPTACRSEATLFKTVNVTFNANGGTPTSQIKTCAYDVYKKNSCTPSSPNVPVKDGYFFVGWSRDSSCACTSPKYFSVSNVSESTTYYACWSAVNCWSCQYNGNSVQYVFSVDKPNYTCANSFWISSSNPSGLGSWAKVPINYCGCGSVSPSPIPQPTPDPSPDVPEEEPVVEEKKCSIDVPSDDKLTCNDYKTLSSTCNELTVNTSSGSADVKIEQNGYISSILTPEKIYAGGGFNFGIIYTNTIKWSYIDGVPNNTLHASVSTEMNKKIKDYNSFISSINVTEINLGGKLSDISLRKQCTTSSTGKDYYNNKLTVTCVFYFPESVLLDNGGVKYIDGAGLGISNKYYTPMDYNGKYEVKAKIVGMSRITDSASKKDSKESNKSWTGTWSDTFKDCQIDLYPLLYKDGGRYNFIYRPIDINNPFPNRNAGINWFDWYNVNSNRDRLESTYSRLQYAIGLDNNKISDIKKYNKEQNDSGGYFDWDTMSDNESTFIDEYFDVKRENIVGDNS